MKYFFLIIFLFILSCSYPDVDSVPKFESFGRESCSELSISEGRSSKVDGRSKPRTQKQIQSYRYNFSKRIKPTTQPTS